MLYPPKNRLFLWFLFYNHIYNAKIHLSTTFILYVILQSVKITVTQTEQKQNLQHKEWTGREKHKQNQIYSWTWTASVLKNHQQHCSSCSHYNHKSPMEPSNSQELLPQKHKIEDDPFPKTQKFARKLELPTWICAQLKAVISRDEEKE